MLYKNCVLELTIKIKIKRKWKRNRKFLFNKINLFLNLTYSNEICDKYIEVEKLTPCK